MKPEAVNRHGSLVTIKEHDANPLPESLHTPLLDMAVERSMYPTLYEALDVTIAALEVPQPKPKYHYEHICECGYQGRAVCKSVRKLRVYDTTPVD